MGITTAPVLVLNQNYEPLNVCTVRRAFVLVVRGKAEILENGRGHLHTPTVLYAIPSIIRLVYLILRPRPRGRLTRRDVFLRDRFTCQYCGKHTKELTLDHVIPRRRDGGHDWNNVVTACKPCNHRKAGRTPQEAHLRLIRQPFRPPFSFYRIFYVHLEQQVEWRKFVPGFEADGGFA